MRNNRKSILIKLAVAVGVFNLLAVFIISAEDKQDKNSDSQLPSDWQIDNQFVEPRQYFKINVAPKKIQRSKLATEFINRRATGNSAESSAISQSQDQQTSIVPGNVGKQKISNATLKKLLNQSLLKSSPKTTTSTSNSSSATSGESNKSNFKFVFIQRATAAPKSIKSQQNSQSPSHQSSPSSSTQQPSLAASVSRQLASSLLKSAVEIVAENLDSAKPSLSALASQLAAANSISIDTSNKKSNLEQNKQADNDANKATQVNSLADDQKSSTKIKTTKVKVKQPSKIYNLPVKFVSNGQPNHVVFSTIRQHFATIKKMQQAAAQSVNKGSTLLNQNSNRNNQQLASVGKRRKPQHQKFKSNSKLIYLPLKYLSNARPNKIITTGNTKSVHN